MHDAARQLEQVRSRARLWLLVLHLLQFAAVLAPVMLILALIDLALNLPGWLRLLIGLFVLIESCYWLLTRLYRAVSFKPRLGDLALRAERIYPQLAGVFASSVELQTQSASDPSAIGPHQKALVDLTLNKAQQMMYGVRLSRLIDLSHVARWFVMAMLAVFIIAAAVVYAPATSRTAMARWFAPLGSTQWPKRVLLVDATISKVCPVDAPVRLMTHVQRGHKPGMRVWVSYRLTDAQGQAGDWQRVLMTQQRVNEQVQDVGSFYERMIDLPPTVIHSISSQPGGAAELEYTFTAGDGQTTSERITLIARPAVTALHATIDPPVYAAGLISSQTVALHEQSGQIATASAVIGSPVRFEVLLNKPVSITNIDLPAVLPGLIDAIGNENVALQTTSAADEDKLSNRFTVSFTLTSTFNTRVHLIDEYSLENLSQRRYRIEAVEDSPPSVSITEPIADEPVLATAIIDLAASAQDDIGLEHLELTGLIRHRDKDGKTVETSLPNPAEQSGRQPTLEARAIIDLSMLSLNAGDALLFEAVARDVYELNDNRHDPVRSMPRTLRIIDEPALVAQIRGELAGLRQQVVRLEQTQQRIQSEQPPSVTLPQQQQITQRLDAQSALLDRLEQRIDRNRLEDQPMRELLRQADDLVRQARNQSSNATANLQQADENPEQTEALEEQAHEDQEAVRETLSELANLLDQGRDVLTLQLQLKQLKTQQESIATDTRELLPRTIGQDPEQLNDEDRQRLEDLRKRQEELADQADDLTRQMQMTADNLARQGERDQDLAAAEALAEAAAIGERQGLNDTMDQASQSMQRNQLSQSGQQQEAALNTIDKMLAEVGNQEQRRQAILRRRLQELSALLRKLIERQNTHAEILEKAAADQVVVLEPGQVAIRRSTMGAQQQAGASNETEKVASQLEQAVSEQGSAVGSLRQGEAPPAHAAEVQAIEHLTAALEELNKITQDNAAEQAREQRQQLREAYLKYAELQEALRGSVSETVDQGPLDRQRRAALVGLSTKQTELQQQVAETGEQVIDSLVFHHMHEQIESTSSRVVSNLQRGIGDQAVQLDQQTIATTLRAMAEALKVDPKNSQFADNSGGGGGGGGGGDQQQGDNPAVPPIAELKLIHGLQNLVYDQTKQIENSRSTLSEEPIKQRMLEVSTQQRELSVLGERLIEQMQQQNQPGMQTPEENPS